jgi:membrane protein required for colicin V production
VIVDLIVALIVLVLGLRGLVRGFLREAFSFAGWLGGCLAAVWLLDDVTPIVVDRLHLPAPIGGLVAFVGVFLVVAMAIWIAGWLLAMIVRITVILRPVDRLAGLALGIAEGLVLAGVLVLGFRESPLFPVVRRELEASALSEPLAERTAALFRAVRDETKSAGETPAGERPPATESTPASKPRRHGGRSAPSPGERL